MILTFLNLQTDYESWKQFRKSSFWKSISRSNQKENGRSIELDIREMSLKYPASKIKELTISKEVERWLECLSIGIQEFIHSITSDKRDPYFVY
jgi:hypothetical protein